MRFAVASLMQETNTFAIGRTSRDDFVVAFDGDAAIATRETNSEMAGALDELTSSGVIAEPLLHAWAMPGGPVEHTAYLDLRDELLERMAAGTWDAVVLSLHGAMVTTETPDADGDLLASVRAACGEDVPIVACLDLHANVTRKMVAAADAVIGYHTDPHVDMADTGRRAARLALAAVGGRRPATVLAKRPMIVPAESMNTTTGVLGDVRALIEVEAKAVRGVLDISLFPVQPWLDVPELSFGVLVTTYADPDQAAALAERCADEVWSRRRRFVVGRLLDPASAVAAASSSSCRPFVIAESADAPTAGAAGDSPVMVAALAEQAPGLLSYIPVVDPAAVAACRLAGEGAQVELRVGAGVDDRWWRPVPVSGRVDRLGDGSYRLAGAGYTGMEVSMGHFAVVSSHGLRLLLTERAAWTSDPATFRHAGLDPLNADVIVVRSCSDFRPNYPASSADAVTLDVPGAATPRLENLQFLNAPRPLWPLDDVADVTPPTATVPPRPEEPR